MAAAVHQAPCDDFHYRFRHPAKCSSPTRKSRRRSRDHEDRLPSAEEIERCGELPIVNTKGEAIPFKSLFDQNQRHFVIFVRHFFCGMCQDYLQNLAAAITPELLQSLPEPTQLSIISCGSPDLIEDYASYTNHCPFTIYTDPSRELYNQFDMPSNLNQGSVKPAYQTSNFIAMCSKNAWQVISHGSNAMKGGNFSQLGGEMLFENGKVVWCHRMQNTRDHTEVDQVKRVLGLP